MPYHQQTECLSSRKTSSLLFALTAALLLFNHSICASEVISKGSVQITLPTHDWEEAEPPAEIMAAYEKNHLPVKMVFHAISRPAGARFFITRFDFPPQQDLDAGLASYLDGVRRRCARQAAGQVIEKSGNYHGVPYKSMSFDLPNGMFVEIRTVLCNDHLYSLEMGGLAKARAEADQCLNSLVLTGEMPFSAATFDSAEKNYERKSGTTAAYEYGKKTGYFLGVCLFVGFAIFIIQQIVRNWLPSRSATSKPVPNRHVPPPLPVQPDQGTKKSDDSPV